MPHRTRILAALPALAVCLHTASARAPQSPQRREPAASVAQDEVDHAELGLWEAAANGGDAERFKTYLTKYPRGRFGGEARKRLAALLGEPYADLFTKRLEVRGRWADVEKQLMRRADVIPKLVEAAQSAGVQEPEIFGQIAEARAGLLNATQGEGGDKTREQKQAVIDAANSFGDAIGRLLSLQEPYPPLRSNEIFLNLQYELAGVEIRIAAARKDYNDAAVDYNHARVLHGASEQGALREFIEEPLYRAGERAPAAPAPGRPPQPSR